MIGQVAEGGPDGDEHELDSRASLVRVDGEPEPRDDLEDALAKGETAAKEDPNYHARDDCESTEVITKGRARGDLESCTPSAARIKTYGMQSSDSQRTGCGGALR